MNVQERKQRYRHVAPVNTREELIYLLSRASELEHGLACVYLFAAYSLKRDASEGLTEEEVRAVNTWKHKLVSVAVEEMLHLAQVTNLLTAIGGAPHFYRPNFPLPSTAFPFGIELSLEPFSKSLIERFVCYEMPEASGLPPGRELEYAEILARVATKTASSADAEPVASEPFEVDFKTIGEFYHKIESGFRAIPEDELFIGPPQAQANAQYLDFSGKLIRITDRASACAAIEMIIEQGEAATTSHPDGHFSVFDSIRIEFAEMSSNAARKGRTFEPARPVVSNPMTHRYGGECFNATIITDEKAHEVADLFNGTYDTMLLMLLRFFAHGRESEDELRLMARGTLRLMASALRPLGEALTKLPAGNAFPGRTAGPGFGYSRDIHLLPHHDAAWVLIAERLRQLVARTCAVIAAGDVPFEIDEAAAALQSVTDHLAPLLPARFAAAIPAVPRICPGHEMAITPEPNGPYLVMNLQNLTNSKGERLGTRAAVALCRCGGSAIKPYCDGTHARIGFNSEKLPDRTPDHLDRYEGKDIMILDNRGTCCHSGNCSDYLPAVFRAGKEPFIDATAATKDEIISIVRQCPSGALGYVDGTFTYSGEERETEIYVSQDGPYHVRGGIKLDGVEQNTGASTEHYALCRCGHSKNKPFCDGTHWYIKFHDEDN